MTDCLFCRILRNEIPAKKIYEDEHTFAFEDINPQAPTHVLIIPKRHVRGLKEATPEDAELIGRCHLAAAHSESEAVEATRRRARLLLADPVVLRAVARAFEPLRCRAERHPATEMHAPLVQRDDPDLGLIHAIEAWRANGAGGPANAGAGVKIAIVDENHDPNLQASLDAFDAQYNLPRVTLNVINQAGNQTDLGWAVEETLDVEWAHAIAPRAHLLLVEAASPSMTDLMSAVDYARHLHIERRRTHRMNLLRSSFSRISVSRPRT